MKTFTIDENNITAVATKGEASSITELAFSSQKELAKLTAEWPAGRFIEIWNGFAGVAPFGELKPVKKFTDRKVAVARIWQAIQRLGTEAAANGIVEQESQPEPDATAESEATPEIEAEPVAETPLEVATKIEPPAPEVPLAVVSVPEVVVAPEIATLAPQVPDVAPEVAAATTDGNPAENAPDKTVAEPASIEQTATKQPKRKNASKPAQEPAAPRETKLSQVVAMLQRPEGATITEIMRRMGWLKHTVRGFMAGTMKKADYNVESFKPEGGERSYRIPSK